jgi:hypothetical protein
MQATASGQSIANGFERRVLRVSVATEVGDCTPEYRLLQIP